MKLKIVSFVLVAAAAAPAVAVAYSIAYFIVCYPSLPRKKVVGAWREMARESAKEARSPASWSVDEMHERFATAYVKRHLF